MLLHAAHVGVFSAGLLGSTSSPQDTPLGKITPLHSLPASEWDPVPAKSFAISPDDQSVVIADGAGALRRLTLPEGEEIVRSAAHLGDERVSVHLVGGRLLALGAKKLTIHDVDSLLVRGSEELEGRTYCWAATEAGDAFVTGRRHGAGRLHRLVEANGVLALTSRPLEGFSGFVDVAFSPDGSQLAVATVADATILDSRTLEVVWGPSAPVPRSVQCLAYYGDDQLAVGWGDQSQMEQPGVDVFSLLPEGAQVRLATSVVLPFGGAATAIHCDPALRLLTFTVSAAGVIAGYSYEDGQWQEAWGADYMGGNPGTLVVERCAGTQIGFVSGMHASLVDLRTGRISHRAHLRGFARVDGALKGTLIVGLRAGKLLVLRR